MYKLSSIIKYAFIAIRLRFHITNELFNCYERESILLAKTFKLLY